MKKRYYVRYYQTCDPKQMFEQFLQAIASVGLRLHTVCQKEFEREGRKFIEYTTIWEIDERRNYVLIDEHINQALASKNYNNK
jgi:hypothetical protein